MAKKRSEATGVEYRSAESAQGEAADNHDDMYGSAPEASSNGTPSPAESKSDKWKRLVNARFPKAKRALERLESLGTRSQYEYTPDQVDRLIEALRILVSDVEKAHTKGKTATPAVLFE